MNKRSVTARMALILLGLVLGPARAGYGSAFHVAPIRVDFDKGTASALLTLTNESPDELRFQISASRWQQDPNGNMQLSPTEDILFFPALLSLKPNEERKVRVATAVKPGDQEQTYRIFFEELPPIETVQKQNSSQVRIVTKIGVPIFVAPREPKASAEVVGFRQEEGKIAFDVRNTGNVHFMAQKVKVTALDESGKTIFQKEHDGWYVLTGSARHYDLELKPEECAGMRTVRVQVETDITNRPETSTVPGTFVVTQPRCSRAASSGTN